MIRTKQIKKADLILTADWHLRETIPICRIDDYPTTQWTKVDFISELQRKHNCPVIHAGDLYDYWKPSPALLSDTIKHLPDQFYTVYGNHDLPQHSMELAHKCGIYTLYAANAIHPQCRTDIEFLSWNEKPKSKTANILVWHIFTWTNREPFPGCSDLTATCLLRKYPQFDLIVTGDNHKPFTSEYKGRLLVNPGSMMRMDADQINHRPRVYLWHSETNTVEPVFIPIEKNVISREHLELKERQNNRIEAFVGKLNDDWQVKASFEDNLKQFESTNKIHKSVMDLVYKSIE
jgi:DNA repair exonuclease SbcCD nuclease subunit